jgi:hypothetical protein
MAKKPVVCRLGIHSYVYAHPRDEHEGPDQYREQVCRRCEKGRDDHIIALPKNPPRGLGPTIFS